MKAGAFVTGTSTDVGKTIVTCALIHALHDQGHSVTAIKPIETGCNPDPIDAVALANACGRPELAHISDLYRAKLPLAPLAATMESEATPPSLEQLAHAVRQHTHSKDVLIVEGAGGLLVPVHEDTSIANLVMELELPLIIVAANKLGVLSDTLATVECAVRRGIQVLGVVLNETSSDTASHISHKTNLPILQQRLPIPVLPFPHVAETTPSALLEAAKKAKLSRLLTCLE